MDKITFSLSYMALRVSGHRIKHSFHIKRRKLSLHGKLA